jgi:TusA-related sulfurtransferase
MMEKASAVLDLRGELCPYPALYAGARLKRMASGEILEVVADGLCAMEGLPDAISQAGHKLIKVETLANGIYRYTIEVA